jgi:beta-phosphoglucomutase family hydrolase
LAFIFDMDGVLVDSNPAHREAWEAFNRRYGVETTEAMHRFMYGRRNDEIVRGFFGADLPAGEVAARGAAKERLYREMVAGKVDRMMPAGLRRFLDARRDAPMALASNAEPENVAFVLKEAGLAKYFRVVVDGHQVKRPKPFPDIYRRAAELLGEPPDNCIVFEDSYSGVEAARAAGMRVVGIRTTHWDLPGADIAIGDFLSEELEAWLGAQGRVA